MAFVKMVDLVFFVCLLDMSIVHLLLSLEFLFSGHWPRLDFSSVLVLKWFNAFQLFC